MRDSVFKHDATAVASVEALTQMLPTELKQWMPLLQELLPGLQLQVPADFAQITSSLTDKAKDEDGYEAAFIKAKREKQLELLVTVLHCVSKNRPVLCLLDSCHSLDSISWELIEKMLQLVSSGEYAGAGFAICMVTRPMHHTSSSHKVHCKMLERVHRAQTVLEIGALQAEEYIKFARQCLGLASGNDAPRRLLDYVWEKSQGNPLFVREVLNNVLAEGAAYVSDGQCSLVEGRSLTELPTPKLLKLIAKNQIDCLTTHEQMVCKVASVLTQPFTLRALHEGFVASSGDDKESEVMKQMEQCQGDALKELAKEGVFQVRVVDGEGGRSEMGYAFRDPILRQEAVALVLSEQQGKIEQADPRRGQFDRNLAAFSTMESFNFVHH